MLHIILLLLSLWDYASAAIITMQLKGHYVSAALVAILNNATCYATQMAHITPHCCHTRYVSVFYSSLFSNSGSIKPVVHKSAINSPLYVATVTDTCKVMTHVRLTRLSILEFGGVCYSAASQSNSAENNGEFHSG